MDDTTKQGNRYYAQHGSDTLRDGLLSSLHRHPKYRAGQVTFNINAHICMFNICTIYSLRCITYDQTIPKGSNLISEQNHWLWCITICHSSLLLHPLVLFSRKSIAHGGAMSRGLVKIIQLTLQYVSL